MAMGSLSGSRSIGASLGPPQTLSRVNYVPASIPERGFCGNRHSPGLICGAKFTFSVSSSSGCRTVVVTDSPSNFHVHHADGRLWLLSSIIRPSGLIIIPRYSSGIHGWAYWTIIPINLSSSAISRACASSPRPINLSTSKSAMCCTSARRSECLLNPIELLISFSFCVCRRGSENSSWNYARIDPRGRNHNLAGVNLYANIKTSDNLGYGQAQSWCDSCHLAGCR